MVRVCLFTLFQNESLQEWPIESNLAAMAGRLKTRRIVRLRCPQRPARAVRQLPKLA